VAGGPVAWFPVSAGGLAAPGRARVPLMAAAVELLAPYPQLELIWASPRELLNIFHADSIGCHIITVTHDLLKKLSLVGKDLDEYSLDTVKMFRNDAVKAGFRPGRARRRNESTGRRDRAGSLMSRLGIVAIGRNEGERLRRCLESVVGLGHAIVYVDSGSTDGSVDLARALGAEVVELDLSVPFTAARARNAGFERLGQVDPRVELGQVVDGDCGVCPRWLGRACEVPAERPDVAVVAGRIRERHRDQTIYNRLADLEMDTPIGEVKACGGIALIRAGAFR